MEATITKLEKLLEEIDPSKTIDLTEKYYYCAMATYHRKKNTVDSREEYETCIAEMYWHLYPVNIKTGYRPNEEKEPGSWCLPKADIALTEEFGHHSIAYEIMNTGAEGGVFGILQILGRLMMNQYSRITINSRVCEFLRSLKSDELYPTFMEYKKLFKGLVEIQTYYLLRLDIVLNEHPFTIKRIRELNG